MKLEQIIRELKQTIETGKISPREAGELIDGRIEVPDDFELRHDSVEFTNMNYGSKEDSPLYHLLVSGFPKRTLNEIQPILNEVFARAQDLKIEKGTANIEYSVLWTPEAFKQEKKLTGLFYDEVEVSAKVYTCDPAKTRIGMPGQSHEIEAKTKGIKMHLKATGEYQTHLEELVEMFAPQIAILKLSKEDAERVLRKIKTQPRGIYAARLLEKSLQPKETGVMNISIGGGINFGTEEVIEIPVFTSLLKRYEDAIGGKSLIVSSPNQESKVTEFIKIYGLKELWKGKRLSDLQALAEEIPQMNLGIIYDYPVLTTFEAKALLDKEIELINKSYKNPFFFGMNSHMIRGRIVKRLASEHFGEEILEGFDESTTNSYIALLKKRGYSEPSAATNEACKSEPDYIAREMHLLEFFNQSYAKDPRESIQKFREFYKNEPPKIQIFADSKKDASKLRKLKLPSQGRLYSFKIAEPIFDCRYSNVLSINRTLPLSEDIHFFSRTSIDAPIFLPLQEYACDAMEIKFK